MKSLIALVAFAFSHSAFAGVVYLSANTPPRVLPECEGTVETHVDNGTLNIEFHNVKECSNFDIVNANYEPTDYPNKKLQGKNQDRSGSFSIPKRYVELGRNQVIVMIHSNNQTATGHGDAIVIKFDAEPAPAPIPAPMPVPAPAPKDDPSVW